MNRQLMPTIGRKSGTAYCGMFVLFFLAVLFVSCREDLPLAGANPPSRIDLHFTPGDYFSFDNWQLDYYGRRIRSSYYRNSWTVADTGVSMRGEVDVTVMIDSTFDSTGQLARLDSLFFRVDANGDLFQYGFLSSLIAERESLNLAPQWDRIAAFSQPRDRSWIIARIDTGMGAPSNQTVVGKILSTQEYIGPVGVDGELRLILCYRIEISKPNLDIILWLSDAPTSFPQMLDGSEILPNAQLRELKIVKPAHW